jgi:hypothetical protein
MNGPRRYCTVPPPQRWKTPVETRFSTTNDNESYFGNLSYDPYLCTTNRNVSTTNPSWPQEQSSTIMVENANCTSNPSDGQPPHEALFVSLPSNTWQGRSQTTQRQSRPSNHILSHRGGPSSLRSKLRKIRSRLHQPPILHKVRHIRRQPSSHPPHQQAKQAVRSGHSHLSYS